MTDKNANTEIHKEFCPNCEAETPCTHEAELYVCDICGEDFAKYIVSRNCNASDVSMTQDVSTDIKTPSSIENTNPDYYKQELARIAELETENAALKETQRWIPVGERLPEEGKEVLVVFNGGCVVGCHLTNQSHLDDNLEFVKGDVWELGIEGVSFWAGEGYEGVTHWMPLPELPAEAQE